MLTFKWIFLMNIICFPTAHGQFTFTSSPGTQRTQERNSVDLTWGLSSLMPVDSGDIHLSQTMILEYQFGIPTYHNGYTNISAPFLFNMAAKTVSVRITSVNKNTDAGQYSCTHTSFSTGGSTKTNSTAVIYVYGQPSGASITPPVPVVTEGDDLQLVCQSQSTSEPAAYRPNPPLTYRWYRGSDNITDSPPDRHSISGNQLTITGVQRGDSGHSYSCQSQETGGLQSNLSPGVNIDVQYSPGQSTTTTPSITDVFEGQDEVVMRCSVTDPGNPPLSQYTWSKDGSSQGTTPTGTRTIAAADLSVNNHDGNWQCRAVNTIGQGQPADISLTVYALPLITSPPSGSGPYEVEAENRGSLSVLCSASGRPPPVVSWTYNGGLPNGIETVAEADSTSGKLTTVNRRLRWTAGSTLEQRRLTGGVYTCTGAVLTETPATITVEVDVQYGPYNTGISPGQDQTVTENRPLSLTCTSSCNPGCSYTWTRPDQTTSQGSVLSFPAIKRTDHGQYSCRASNGRGQPQEKDIFIAVHYPPEPSITISPAGDLVEGTSVTVTCTVDSRPESSITWTNITDQQPPVYDNINTNTTHSIIRFSAINILDSATLHCIADNSVAGSPKQSPVVLDVYGPARTHITLPADRRVGSGLGENTNFTVWVIANPIPSPGQWSWKYYPENVTAERVTPPNVILTVEEEKAFLNLTNITMAHYGNYSMTATNSYGGWEEGEVIFQLTAFGKPSDPRNFQVIKTTAVSITVQWVTGFNGGRPQTFTISYKNMNTGVTLEETGIPDVGSSSGEIMSKKITRGIEDDTPYELQIKAVNEIGLVEGQITSLITPAKATVGSKPTVITLHETTADIVLYVTGQLTHVDIKNCVKGKETCLTETVVITNSRKKRHNVGYKDKSGALHGIQKLRNIGRVNLRVKRQESEVLEITATVQLADATAKKFTFQFLLFDGEDLVSEEIAPVEEARPGMDVTIIIGAVVGGVLLAAIVIIIVVLWRKGIIPKKDIKHEKQNRTLVDEENEVKIDGIDNAANLGGSSPYSMAGPIDDIEPYASHSNIQKQPNNTTNLLSATGASYSEVPNSNGSVEPEAQYSQVNKAIKPPIPGSKPKPADKPFNPRSSTGSTRPVSVYPPALSKSAKPSEQPPVYAQVNKPRKPAASNDEQSNSNAEVPNNSSDIPPVYAEVNKAAKAPGNTVDNRGGEASGVKSKTKGKGGIKFPFFKSKDKKDPLDGQQYENVEMKAGPAVSKKVDKSKDKPYVNVKEASGPEGPYSEVRVPGLGNNPTGGEVSYQNFAGPQGDNPYANVDAHGKRPAKQFQRVGVDGTLYAELEHMRLEQEQQATQQPVVIHGAENKTEYASIDYNKLKKRKT